MKVEYRLWSEKDKRWVFTERAPTGQDDFWASNTKYGQWFPKQIVIILRDEGTGRSLEVSLVAGYNRCCGLREIGAINFGWQMDDDAKRAFVRAFAELPVFKIINNGALLYTKVKDRYEHPQDRDGQKFVELWPYETQESGWWYNPNSGNYCSNVTLCMNVTPTNYDDDYEDEED